MIHNYPYTDFHELNLDYLMKLARESMGLHFEQADKFLKLVNAQGQEVSRAKIYYAETALKDDLGNNIDAYIISTSLQGDNIIFTKGNGEYTTITIPYAVKASKDVNNVDLTSYIHGLSVAGDKLLITYGNGETASITVPYAVKASTDENGKSITTYVADLSTGNNKLIVKDGDGTTIAELTIPYATSALNDVDGDAIKSTYGTDLTTDTTTVQLRSKDGAIISTITVPYATKALSDDQGNNFRSDYGFNLATDGNKVALESHDGTTLNEITVPFATLATDATNAIQSVSISGDEIVFTTYGGNSYRITSPYAVKALKDNLNNTITTTYVASVTNDPDTGEISFYASDGSLISTLIPTLDSAIHDSYGNLIGDFVKEIIVNPQNNYVVVNHGTGDSDTLTINYATHAYKDTYENVIGNTYIRSLSIITDPSDNKKYLVAYNGELSELFRISVSDNITFNDLSDVDTSGVTNMMIPYYDANTSKWKVAPNIFTIRQEVERITVSGTYSTPSRQFTCPLGTLNITNDTFTGRNISQIRGTSFADSASIEVDTGNKTYTAKPLAYRCSLTNSGGSGSRIINDPVVAIELVYDETYPYDTVTIELYIGKSATEFYKLELTASESSPVLTATVTTVTSLYT